MKVIKGIVAAVILVFGLIMVVNFFPHEVDVGFNSVDVLAPIQEAAVYLDEHTTTEVVKDAFSTSDVIKKLFDKELPQFMDKKVPGTTKTIAYSYTSTVKLGIKNFAEIPVNLDRETKTITVKLSKIEVLDNYIELKNTDESNNFVNTISAEDVMKFEAEKRAEALERVKNNGSYEAAAVQIKDLITKQFNVVCPDYTVEFA